LAKEQQPALDAIALTPRFKGGHSRQRWRLHPRCHVSFGCDPGVH
jgi:hypothetical protein